MTDELIVNETIPEQQQLPDNILDMKQFEKVGDTVIDKRHRKTPVKSNKKKSKSKEKQTTTTIETELTMDFEKEFFLLLEENEFLRYTIIEEQVKRKTTEKILNKVLRILGSKDLPPELDNKAK